MTLVPARGLALLTLDGAAQLEDRWRPATRPDIPIGPGRWGAEPYPNADFLRLLRIAMAAPHLPSPPVFCDVGAGVGVKVLLAGQAGRLAWGVEAVAAYQAAAASIGADVLLGEACRADYSRTDIAYVNDLYRTVADQARFEDWLCGLLRPGAVLITVNSPGPPHGWAHLTHEPAAWRGVYVKPAAPGPRGPW